jgi:hypothetical protein
MAPHMPTAQCCVGSSFSPLDSPPSKGNDVHESRELGLAPLHGQWHTCPPQWPLLICYCLSPLN